MAQRKISAYWLILIAAVLAVALGLSVTTAYARFVTTAQWNTLVSAQPAPEEMLVLNGIQTVDLGQLPLGSTEVQFSLEGELTETVTCSAPEGIGAEMQNAEGMYTLTLKVEAYPATTAVMQIPVMAGEQSLGIFRVILPGTGVTEPPDDSGDDVQAGEEPTEEDPEVTTDNTEETPEDTTGNTEETPEDTTGNTEETPEDTTGNTEETPEDTADDTENAPENGGQTQSPDEELTDPYLQVVTPNLLTNSLLEIKLAASGEADRVALTLLGSGFPAGTRYSTDGGSNWYLLYFGGAIWLEAGAELSVLVDVTDTSEVSEGTQTLSAESYCCNERITTLSSEVCYGTVTLTSTELMTDPGETLTVTLPECMGAYEFIYTIEILTTDAAGNLTYADATAAFAVTVDATNTMTVRFADQLPQAGTYRLNLTWINGETLTNQSLTPFFISYSDANTGGAE